MVNTGNAVSDEHGDVSIQLSLCHSVAVIVDS